mmetsp:Transcript_12329/g.27657  ORF Transcript_12329/g.27657 Transcript_12329/m.27657 type:complete len:304 (+) Transcript_12329:360-1271(+)
MNTVDMGNGPLAAKSRSRSHIERWRFCTKFRGCLHALRLRPPQRQQRSLRLHTIIKRPTEPCGLQLESRPQAQCQGGATPEAARVRAHHRFHARPQMPSGDTLHQEDLIQMNAHPLRGHAPRSSCPTAQIDTLVLQLQRNSAHFVTQNGQRNATPRNHALREKPVQRACDHGHGRLPLLLGDADLLDMAAPSEENGPRKLLVRIRQLPHHDRLHPLFLLCPALIGADLLLAKALLGVLQLGVVQSVFRRADPSCKALGQESLAGVGDGALCDIEMLLLLPPRDSRLLHMTPPCCQVAEEETAL